MIKSRSGGEITNATATALIRCVNDPDIAARIAASKALGSIISSVVKSGSGGETVRAGQWP